VNNGFLLFDMMISCGGGSISDGHSFVLSKTNK